MVLALTPKCFDAWVVEIVDILGYTTDMRERFRHREKGRFSSAIETKNARSENVRRAKKLLVVNREG
jgi:hypothetical protein